MTTQDQMKTKVVTFRVTRIDIHGGVYGKPMNELYPSERFIGLVEAVGTGVKAGDYVGFEFLVY